MNVSGPFGACSGLGACPVSGMGCMMGQSGNCCAQSSVQAPGLYSYVCESSGGNGGNGGNGGGNSPVNGSCGGAARNYSYLETSFSGFLCNSGVISPNVSSISFPAQGGSTSWRCNGQYGGSDDNCLAVRGAPPSPPAPTLTFTASGNGVTGGDIAIPNNTEATLTWTSGNATSCTASGSWSGPKVFNTTWSERTGNLTTNPTGYVYTLRCDGAAGTSPTVASVRVRVTPPLPPLAVPVISHSCNAAGTWVTLNYGVPTATAYYLRIDEYTGSNPSWNGLCTAPDRCIDATASPSYSGPVLPGVTYGSWVHAYRGSDPPANSPYYTFQCNAPALPTLTVGVTASPASETVPFPSSIQASVTGTATGNITYTFDCGNGTVLPAFTSGSTTETRQCTYSSANSYTPRVTAVRQGVAAVGQTSVQANAPAITCGSRAATYATTETGWKAGTFCNPGTASQPSVTYPSAPIATNTTRSWTCGLSTCSATWVCSPTRTCTASDICEGESCDNGCGVITPGTKDCRQFWREVAP